MNTEFEDQLQRQPFRELPTEWRSQILGAAENSVPRSISTATMEWFAGWLWPHPRAWAGLAAAWIIILLLHFTAPDEPQLAANSHPMTVQSVEAMQRQTVIMARLLGSLDGDAQPPAAIVPPKPRSEGPRRQRIG